MSAGSEESAAVVTVLRTELFETKSGRTMVLVTFGRDLMPGEDRERFDSMDGTKAANARELGTRIVHPDVHELLLRALQPAVPRPTAVAAEVRGTPAEVRRWARDNGWVVGDRGRLPARLLDAYAPARTDDVAEGDAAPV